MNAKNYIAPMSRVAIGAGLAGWLLMIAGGAHAQDALGGGDALDAGLNIQGPRNLPSVDTSQAYRLRNLLVTGNVAGGREFRDSVGYTAAEDFREVVGSDDLFRFRADSAFSAPNYVLYKDQLTDMRIGQDLSTLEFRRSTTPPMAPGVSPDTFRYNNSRELGAANLRMDRLISDVSLSQEIERAAESRPIGMGYDSEGRALVPMTTSVIGIQTYSLNDAARTAGMSVLDRARLYEDLVRGTPGLRAEDQAYAKNFTELLMQAEGRVQPDNRVQPTARPEGEDRVQTDSTATRVDARDDSYETMMREVAQRFAGVEQLDQEKLNELDKQYEVLRSYLRGEQPGAEGAEVVDPLTGEVVAVDPQSGPEIPPLPALPGTEPQTQPAETTPPVAGDMGRTDDVVPTLESFGIALRHGQEVHTYATGSDDRFNELVKQAEESLATGEYFYAERRFQRALRFQMNHPLATAGRGHAQIGAGLYLPAALTLKFVLARYPELIDVRYNPSILPTNVRLDQNIETIRERIQNDTDVAEMGFLLAYIGHQTGNRELVDEGLAVFEEQAPSDRLLNLLKRVWLGQAGAERTAPAEK